jgi:hypothetical protein
VIPSTHFRDCSLCPSFCVGKANLLILFKIVINQATSQNILSEGCAGEKLNPRIFASNWLYPVNKNMNKQASKKWLLLGEGQIVNHLIDKGGKVNKRGKYQTVEI